MFISEGKVCFLDRTFVVNVGKLREQTLSFHWRKKSVSAVSLCKHVNLINNAQPVIVQKMVYVC